MEGNKGLTLEEKKLWKKYFDSHKEDISIRNEIILKYRDLIVYIINADLRKYLNAFMFDDLFQWGVFGLIDAIEKYEIGRDIKFTSYAFYRIKGYICDRIRDEAPHSRYAYKRYMNIKAYIEQEREKGNFVSAKEVAQHFFKDGNLKRYYKLMLSYTGEDSIYKKINSTDGVDTFEYISVIENKNIIDPEKSLEKKEFMDIVYDIVEDDNAQHGEYKIKFKDVFVMYYELGLKLKEIADVYGCTDCLISQYITDIHKLIKIEFRKRGITKDYFSG